MASLPKVTVDDVAARYFDGDGNVESLGTKEQIQGLIDDVVDDITVNYGSRVLARIASGVVSERTFKRVVATVVLRVLRNPDGIYRETLGTYQYQMSQKVASGYLMYLPEEINALVGAASVPFGAFIASPVNMAGGSAY